MSHLNYEVIIIRGLNHNNASYNQSYLDHNLINMIIIIIGYQRGPYLKECSIWPLSH
jgi:hypothetical protein